MLLGFAKDEKFLKSRHEGWYSLSQTGKTMENGMFDDDEPPIDDEDSWANERCVLVKNNSENKTSIVAVNCLDTNHTLVGVCEFRLIRVRISEHIYFLYKISFEMFHETRHLFMKFLKVFIFCFTKC